MVDVAISVSRGRILRRGVLRLHRSHMVEIALQTKQFAMTPQIIAIIYFANARAIAGKFHVPSSFPAPLGMIC